MARFVNNYGRLSALYFYGYCIACWLILIPSYSCCAIDAKRLKQNGKKHSLKHKIPSATKGKDVRILKSAKDTKVKSRATVVTEHLVDKNGQKRDKFVTIPEPFPVNRFEQQPYLGHHVNYVPQPYPVTEIKYVTNPIAVPVEVPNQLKVQHFHVHKDCKFSLFYYMSNFLYLNSLSLSKHARVVS